MAVDTTEKKAATTEKNRALAKKRSTKLLAKQNETDVKLAEVISLNTAQIEELADLRATLKACEEKWYDKGFADAENFVEPVVNQAHKVGFEAEWLAALQVLGVPKDSLLRDPGQIPFPSLAAAMQNPPVPIEQINAHTKPDDTEATSIPNAQDQLGVDLLFPVTDQQQTKATDQTGPLA